MILGPFSTAEEAGARFAEWPRNVPDAYVKRGCEAQSDASSDPANASLGDAMLPLLTGLNVLEGSGCKRPANAGMRRFDGRGISGSATRDCRAEILSRDGDTFTVSQSCVDTYDGSRSAERQTIAVLVPDRFRPKRPDGEAVTFERCPNDTASMQPNDAKPPRTSKGTSRYTDLKVGQCAVLSTDSEEPGPWQLRLR